MGDIIDIVTSPRHRRVFYSATSSAIAFDIKGRGQACIGLSSHPRVVSCYFAHERPQRVFIQIGIANVVDDDGTRSSLIEVIQDDNKFRRRTPQILDDDNCGSFWLSWYREKLQLGRQGETTPFYDLKLQGLHKVKYITFYTNNKRNEVRWRFQQPPVIERPGKIVTVSGGKPRWKRGVDKQPNYKAKLPNDAIIGGFENEHLFIIRAFVPGNDQLAPGKFVRSEGLAYVASGGQSHVIEKFDVLCGFNYQWVIGREDMVPANAVIGGYDELKREVLYVGRAYYEGHLIPGKVCCSRKLIFFSYQNMEIALPGYEVLIDLTEEYFWKEI